MIANPACNLRVTKNESGTSNVRKVIYVLPMSTYLNTGLAQVPSD